MTELGYQNKYQNSNKNYNQKKRFLVNSKPARFGKNGKRVRKVMDKTFHNYVKNTIRGLINMLNMEMNTNYHIGLNEKNLHNIDPNEYKVCINTFGKKFLLFLTNYNNQNFTLFIDKKNEVIMITEMEFDDKLYNNTLFDGELIKNQNHDWIYSITNLMIYKGVNVFKESTLDERSKKLKYIFANNFQLNEDKDICKIDIKDYFTCEYIQDLHDRYIDSVPYQCSGFLFQHITTPKAYFYIFPQFRTNNKNTNNTNGYYDGTETSKVKIHPNKDKPFHFEVLKTILPDVYDLYYLHNGKKTKYDIAYIPNMKTSKMLRNEFKDISEGKGKVFMSKYNSKFDKWTPVMPMNIECDSV